jgi:hypothetical protein
MVALATASAAASNTASAEWTYAVSLMPEQGCDSRLVVPEIGGETGEAMAQHMGRDVSRQIAQLGDPQPHLPIPDDYLIGSTGEHHIADPRLRIDHSTGCLLAGVIRAGALTRSG